MNIQKIYEDDNVLVINKPAGVMVHPDGKNKVETLSEWFVTKYQNSRGVGEHITLQDGSILERHGIVHRLDKDTSGVMVLVKNQEAFEFLKEQFKERNTSKTYRAFVYGELKNDTDVIDRPIGRSSTNFRLWSAQRGSRGTLRDAKTEYTVLKRGNGFSYIELRPETGRTHQLRVHMKAINYPIVCDNLYAPKRECALSFNRVALHAYSLKVMLPGGNAEVFTAELPDDFQRAEKMLQAMA